MPRVPTRYACSPEMKQKDDPREYRRARSLLVHKDNDPSFATRIRCPICSKPENEFCDTANSGVGRFHRARLFLGWCQAWGIDSAQVMPEEAAA